MYLFIFDNKNSITLLANESGLIRQSSRFSLQHTREIILSLSIESKSQSEELAQNFFHRGVHFQTSIGIVEHHGCSSVTGLQLEVAMQTLRLCLGQIGFRHGDNKSDCGVSVVLFVVVDQSRSLFRAMQKGFHNRFLVVLRPNTNRQFSNFDFVIADDSHLSTNGITLTVNFFNCSFET